MENSPLSKLSAELRNRIAEFALSHDICHVRPTSQEHKSHLPGFAFTSRDDDVEPAARLLDTCKQMRQEYTKLFYALNSFFLHCTVPGQDIAEGTLSFVKAIGPENAAIFRRLTIDLGRWESEGNETEDLCTICQSLRLSLVRVEKHAELRNLLFKCKNVYLSKTYDARFGFGADTNPCAVEVSLDYFNVAGSLKAEVDRLGNDTEIHGMTSNERELRKFLSSLLEFIAQVQKWRFQSPVDGHGEE